MISLTSPTCTPQDDLCNNVYKVTHSEWLAGAANWLIAKPLAILGLILFGLVVRFVLHKLIGKLATRAGAGLIPDALTQGKLARTLDQAPVSAAHFARRRQRAETMAGVLKSIASFLVFSVILVMVFSELGYDVGPLIAGAGIIGLALGFGAQSLVKDFLSGIFMIVEDQYGVGDVVDVGSASGTVESVSLRVTRLRDLNGTVWYVPNGEIMRVGNMSQNWARAVVDVHVAYHEDLVRVQQVLREVAHDLWEDEDYSGLIIEEPEITGVEQFGPDSVTLRVLLKTAPMEQWGVARALRQRIKARFDHEGITIPLPQRVVWHREDLRDGKPVPETSRPAAATVPETVPETTTDPVPEGKGSVRG
jgi:moderate conductance mechanosensitive channel